MKINHKALVTSLLVLSFGVALVANANHSWGSYHWARESNPFTLKLGDNVSASWDSYLNTSSSQWSLSSVLDTSVVAGGTNNTKGRSTPKNCVPTSGRVEICSENYGNTGWLGIAQIWVSGGHIVQGTTKLNDTYFNSGFYNTPGWRSLVVCQEVGHNFGLGHQDEDFNNLPVDPHTCMDYFVPDANEIVGPNAHDYEELDLIYSHLDSFNSYDDGSSGDSGSGGNGNGKGKPSIVNLDNPSEWGRSLKQDAQGKDNLFVRDLGNGRKVFTHVFWAR